MARNENTFTLLNGPYRHWSHATVPARFDRANLKFSSTITHRKQNTDPVTNQRQESLPTTKKIRFKKKNVFEYFRS